MGLTYMTAGESHGPGLTAILAGMPAGLGVDIAGIDAQLARRQRGYGAGPRMKIEYDRVRILGGVLDGKTTGAPLALWIRNRDHARWEGRAIPPMTTPRPGHVDLAAALKYGYRDLRPGLERASARETAARVAVGAICRQLLDHFLIRIGAYVTAIGGVKADLDQLPLAIRISRADDSEVRCPDSDASAAMMEQIRQAIEARDTLGGILEVVAVGLPPGLGSHVQWNRRLEAQLGAAILSIPAVKGVEIGPAFENTTLLGTQAHDAIRLEGEKLYRGSNRAGGIEGGITTGEPLVIRAAMKPIATTLTPQQSVDLAQGEEAQTQYERSDFCPVPRAVPILEAVVAFVLADALLEKLGGDSLEELDQRAATLRQLRLGDLKMENRPRIWWPKREAQNGERR